MIQSLLYRVEILMPNQDQKPTVFYDGTCPLCTVEVSHYRRLAKDNVDFVDVSTEPNPSSELSQDQAMARFHIRDASGQLHSGAKAFVMLWTYLPGWRFLAPLSRVPGMTLLLELAYRLFLPVRPVLSRVAGWLGAKAEH